MGNRNATTRAGLRVCIVDDHEIVRSGLRFSLGESGRTEIVGEAGSGREALPVMRRTLPDVLITDFRLPDMAGDELCRQVREAFPSTSVVFLTTYLNEDTVRRAIEAGASAFVTKAAGLGELERALAKVEEEPCAPLREGPSEVVRRLHGTSFEENPTRLTPQQERVLELTAAGRTYAQISSSLHISESTVRFHIQRLKQKLEVASNAELIVEAIRLALIIPERGLDSRRPSATR
jgi:DNA-binding NarL/FixJ family response regulator